MGRLLVAGGGTGGHLYPGIAVAREAQREGWEVLFIGAEGGIEARVLPKEGLNLRTIRAGKYMGMGFAGKIKTVLSLPSVVSSARGIIREFRPDAVLGVGGYASFPAVAAAKLSGLPVVIQEQNAWPGLTNRLLGRFADAIAMGFAEAGRFFVTKKIFTGNPIRSGLLKADRAAALERFGLDGARTTVLVFGGSAGAHRINSGIADALEHLAEMKDKVQFIHQTGEKDRDMVDAAYRKAGFTAAVEAFIYDMDNAYACADMVVCRSGALTLAEVSALGKPAVLIPYPFAANNHQEHNARSFEKAGAAKVVVDKDATGGRLASEIKALLGDRKLLDDMATKSRALGHPDAAARVLGLIKEYAKG